MACVANFLIGGVVFELEREQFESELCKLPIADCRLPIGNQIVQARGETGKFFVHAVLFVGWFSATARSHYILKQVCRKRIAMGFAAQDCQ
jgi:hypothetical protein